MTKFSKPKTENALSVKDRLAASSAIWQWIIATERLQSVVSSVPSAIVDSVTTEMTQIASKEQQSILDDLQGFLHLLNGKREYAKLVEKQYVDARGSGWQ